MALEMLDETAFERRVLSDPSPVLVSFTTPWCGPCRALKPTLEALAGRVRVFLIDADANPTVSVRFGVRGFPTTIAFANGAEVGRQLGVATAKRLLALFGSEQVARP